MTRVVICGITASGKTCYFYGMLRKMMMGHHGFIIRPQQKDYTALRMGIKRLGDTKLPLEQRFPAPSAHMDCYTLDLLYNYKQLESFEWVDYPGEFVEQANTDFIQLLEGANCLFICVDGEVIQGDEGDIDEIVETLINDRGGFELNYALSQASEKNKDDLPPICIMVTKYDKVSPALRNKEAIRNIVGQVFTELFSPNSGGATRMVTVCPVTLGKNLDEGAKLDPKGVEMPICFATYLLQLSQFVDLRDDVKGKLERFNHEIDSYNQKGFFKKIITPKPTLPMTKEDAEKIAVELKDRENDVEALRNAIEGMTLYVNGEETEWL